MSPTRAAHHPLHLENTIPWECFVLMFYCLLPSQLSISHPVTQHTGLGWAGAAGATWLFSKLYFYVTHQCLWQLFLLEPTVFTYPPEYREKMIPIQKRFDELTNHHFTFCSSSMKSQSAHRNNLFVYTHLCAGTDPGGHRERLVYRGCHIFTE